jgi:hypothetical protein
LLSSAEPNPVGPRGTRQTLFRKLRDELRNGLAGDGPTLLAIFGFWIACLVWFATNGINGISFSSYQLNLTLYFAAFMATVLAAVVLLLVRHRPARPIKFLAEIRIAGDFIGRIVRGAPMLVALVVFLPLFSKMKSAIPLINSYTWDDTWIELDRALHGTDPWRILQPFFGYPLVTSLLSVLYHSWLVLIYVGPIYFCFFGSDRSLRTRFFIAYFSCWLIVGVAMATAFASVGPCFMRPLLGDGRFDEQMNYLQSANEVFPVLVLPVQQALAAAFHSGSSGLGSGITAMPSMHVALAFLFFLAMRKVSAFASLAFGTFFVLILIGSVHLAYHYAVDGYVGIAVTYVIWLASGVLSRRLARTDSR